MSASPQTARRPPRHKAGWFPKQHGAWAMLVTPWLLGAVLRARAGQAAWGAEVSLLAFWLAAYLLFQAASTWLKAAPVRRSSYAGPVLAYGAFAGCLGVLALWLTGPRALGWVPVFAPLLGVALWLAWRRRERSVLGGVATVAAAAVMGLVARHPVPAWPDTETLIVVGAAFGYFLGTVWYVKTIIRERGKPTWLAASVAYHAVLAAACVAGWVIGGPPTLSWLALFFAACTVRAWVVPVYARRHRVTPAAAGVGEIVATLALVAACLLPG